MNSKEIIREIFIILALCFLIILLLGVLLYDYVPSNKEIPAEISYKTPQEVKEELQTVGDVDEDKVILTYKIDEADLYNYQRVNDYKPGKTNPFSTYKGTTVENTSTNGSTPAPSSSGTTITPSSNGNSESQTSSGGTKITGTNKTTTTEPGTVNPGNYTQNKGLK